MKRLVSWYVGNYKAGGFVIIIFSFTLFILAKLYELITFPVRLFSDSVLVGLLFLVIFPPLLGYFFSVGWLRLLTAKLQLKFPEGKYPRLRLALKFFSPGDIREKNFPEVKVKLGFGDKEVRFIGFVVREWEESGVVWCRVAIPTYPLPATGNFIEVKKSELIYTGRRLEEGAFTFLSFGSK